MADTSRLHALFLAGLAVGCAGSGKLAEPPPTATPAATATPTASATASGSGSAVVEAPPPDEHADEHADARAVAREFRSIGDFSKAFAGVEHVAAVTAIDSKPSFACDPSPCTKEWTKLAKEAKGNGAVVRRNGKLEYVLEGEFGQKLGKVDTAEKAAARLHYYEQTKLATCGQLKTLGVECAKGSDDAGVAVRKVKDGFEVATNDFVSLCPPPSSGGGPGIKFWRVTSEGERTWIQSNPLERLAIQKVGEEVGPGFKCAPGFLGRPYEGFTDLETARSELEYYVRAQRQEAAAVVAFERLAVELAAHHAPAELVEGARRAAREERRHAALFRREAACLGEELGVPVVFPRPNLPEAFVVRALDDILRENLLEGCVSETYSAVIATHQAEHATSERLRAVFRAIAADEREHAALAYRIHAWGLSVSESAPELREELRDATACVRQHVSVTALGLAMGEPDPGVAVVAFEHVAAGLLAA